MGQTIVRCSLAEAQEMDVRLRLFATAHTRVQRFVGQGLDRLYSSDGLLQLSYMTQRDYVRECLGMGVREAQELVHIEHRLVHYPVTEQCWLENRINRCHVREILARVQPDEDMLWAGLASRMTVRELRAHLLDEEARGRRLNTLPEDDDKGGHWLQFEASPALREHFALARDIVNRSFGADVGDAGCLDACGMELRATLSPEVFRTARERGLEVSKEWSDRLREDLNRLQDERERDRERAGAGWLDLPSKLPDVVVPEFALAADATPFDIDRRLQEAVRFDRGVEACLVQMLERACREGVPHVLQFDSLEHYAKQRLGISKSLAWSMVSLGRSLRGQPDVAEAFASGDLSKSCAMEVVRVATPPTVLEWVDYARQNTVRKLRHDVQTALAWRTEHPTEYAHVRPPAAKVLTSPKALAVRDELMELTRKPAFDTHGPSADRTEAGGESRGDAQTCTPARTGTCDTPSPASETALLEVTATAPLDFQAGGLSDNRETARAGGVQTGAPSAAAEGSGAIGLQACALTDNSGPAGSADVQTCARNADAEGGGSRDLQTCALSNVPTGSAGVQTCARFDDVGSAGSADLQTGASPGNAGCPPVIPRVPDTPCMAPRPTKARWRIWIPREMEEFLEESLALCRTWLDLPLTVGECVELMVANLIDEYQHEAEQAAQNHPVVERDGWKCSTPGCTLMAALHVHHMIYRSQGGALIPSNETTMCNGHHLKGVHEGRMVVKGDAPDNVVWGLGIQPDGKPTQIFVGDTRIFPTAA